MAGAYLGIRGLASLYYVFAALAVLPSSEDNVGIIRIVALVVLGSAFLHGLTSNAVMDRFRSGRGDGKEPEGKGHRKGTGFDRRRWKRMRVADIAPEPAHSPGAGAAGGHSRCYARGEEIVSPGAADTCYFVMAGLVSARIGDDAVEVGLVGPGHLLNIGALFGTRVVEHAMIAASDCRVFAIDARYVRQMADASPALKARFADYVQARLVQAMNVSACHALHRLDERLASWIGAASSLLNAGRLVTTHDDLAAAMGARRPSVSVALQAIEETGAIRSLRAAIVVRDRVKLDRIACRCLSRPLPRFGDIWNLNGEGSLRQVPD